MGHIQKLKLASGIFWLEIPKADLRILCGCPADAVKHMMKRGLIKPLDGVDVFQETGPNAILLSDLSVQKSSFSNLGEFPVLQMLYRQGMILPGHPGNTGVKPLLLGQTDQLAAQIEYIHRGNYGLTSLSELMEAGASDEEAYELMRLKLKFAFGKISNPRELFDTIVIENEKTEIRNGVNIKRIDVNIFEISFEDETVLIDLNLQDSEQYIPSYNLGHYQVGREYFSIIHSGEGDGWDVDRPSMASIISFQGKIYLIDAGPNIENTLRCLGIDISEIEGIFMTHCHDDHFAGLPTLIRSDHRIKFFSTSLVRHATVKKLCGLMAIDESRFSQFFDIFDLQEGSWNKISGLEVRPINSPHPMETTIFYFRTPWGAGYKSYGHLADIASFEVMDNMITEDDNGHGMSQDYNNQVKMHYLQAADVKKVDSGGGMIHGMSQDFAYDPSKKIIFAHTSRSLTEEERKIGSGAPFGTQDVLIKSHQDYLYGRAHVFLKSFFPDLPEDQTKLLLNHEIVEFNPEEIILKSGQPVEKVHFILSGSAEIIDGTSNKTHRMSSGSFIGDIVSLSNLPAHDTFRALSFVKALELPVQLYSEFVKRNNMYKAITSLAEKRGLLQRSWLFGGSISDGIKNLIARSMTICQDLSDLTSFEKTRNHIALVQRGEVALKLGNSVFKTLKEGDGFLEDHAVFQMPSIFDLDFSDDCIIALIPLEIIRSIPIVQWKLLESANRQMRELAGKDDLDDSLLEWRDQYSVGIPAIDEQHKVLLSISRELIDTILQHKPSGKAVKLSEELIEATYAHFAHEEEIFSAADYSESLSHMDKHAKLISQIQELKKRCSRALSDHDVHELHRFLKSWMLLHILLEDRKYASYLNSNEIF
jgi:hemerythrin